MLTLEAVLSQWRADAEVLERHGHADHAKDIKKLCLEVESAAADYLAFIEESSASRRTGRSEKWLRAHYPEWEKSGHARKHAGKRYYRGIVLPLRSENSAARAADIAAAMEQGRRAARRE